MKITAVRLFEIHGEMPFQGEFWEERLVRPVDIYPEYKVKGAGWLPKPAEGRYTIRAPVWATWARGPGRTLGRYHRKADASARARALSAAYAAEIIWAAASGL